MWSSHVGPQWKPPSHVICINPHAPTPIKASCDRIPARTFSNLFDFFPFIFFCWAQLPLGFHRHPDCCSWILCFIYECFGVIFLRFSAFSFLCRSTFPLFLCVVVALLNMHEIIQIKGAQPGSALISLRWATKYGSLLWGVRIWRSWSVVDFCFFFFFFKAYWFECSLERFVGNPLGKN